MVGTIGPLVQRQTRQWMLSISGFSAASAVAGGLAGTVLAVASHAVGPLEDHFIRLMFTVAALIVALLEVRLLPLPVPSLHRSVPQAWWIKFGPTRGSLAYGAVLGLGFSTVIPFAGFYLVALAAFLVSLPGGIVIGLAYGLARTLPVWGASLAIATGRNPVVVGRWIMAQRRTVKAGCGVAAAAFAIASVGILWL